MKAPLLAAFISISCSAAVSAHIRKTTVKEDDILTVKTALGIATIIQLPDSVQSAIIGDLSGFKIEYLDRAVTIKPLRWAARTNLYLVTEKRRFNIRLQTGPQETADYIVYLRNPELAKASVNWISVGKSISQDGRKLTIERVGSSLSGFILIDAILSATNTQPYKLKAENIWIKQNGTSRSINSLFLSDLKFQKNSPLRIGISLAKSDLTAGKPLTVELRGELKTLAVQVPESLLWK